MPAIIINPRETRAAWGETLDALCLGAFVLAEDRALGDAERTALTVRTLRAYPDHSVAEMVDRVIAVDAIGARPGGRLGVLADRHEDRHLLDAIWKPVLVASTVIAPLPEHASRLARAIAATGADPGRFGVAE